MGQNHETAERFDALCACCGANMRMWLSNGVGARRLCSTASTRSTASNTGGGGRIASGWSGSSWRAKQAMVRPVRAAGRVAAGRVGSRSGADRCRCAVARPGCAPHRAMVRSAWGTRPDAEIRFPVRLCRRPAEIGRSGMRRAGTPWSSASRPWRAGCRRACRSRRRACPVWTCATGRTRPPAPKIRVCDGRLRQTLESGVGAESASSHERSPGSS
jgi:hypothetical protein